MLLAMTINIVIAQAYTSLGLIYPKLLRAFVESINIDETNDLKSVFSSFFGTFFLLFLATKEEKKYIR